MSNFAVVGHVSDGEECSLVAKEAKDIDEVLEHIKEFLNIFSREDGDFWDQIAIVHIEDLPGIMEDHS